MDEVTVSGGAKGQKQINEVLAALHEVIVSQQTAGSEHEPTPTEYFVVVTRALSTGGAVKSHIGDLLLILNAVAPQSSKHIVRDQFKVVSTILLKILNSTEDVKLTVQALTALGTMIKLQESSDGFWSGVHSLKTVNVFLSLIDDARNKVRRCVHEQLQSLLMAHQRAHCQALSSYVSDFSIEVLRTCTRSEYKRSLYVVFFLESTMALLPAESASGLVKALLGLQACEQPVLSAAMLRTLDSFFQSPHLTLRAVAQLEGCARSLLTSPPSTQDMEANSYYCTAIASVLVRIFRAATDDEAGRAELLVTAVSQLIRSSESEFTQIHCAVATAMKRIVSSCITDAMIDAAVAYVRASKGPSDSAKLSGKRTSTSSSSGLHAPVLVPVLSTIESIIQLRFQHAWLYILDAVRSIFERVRGDAARVLLSSHLLKLADINQAIEAGVIQVDTAACIVVVDTLGSMLRSLGVVHFLALIPFSVHAPGPQFVGVDSTREWILSLMHNNLRTQSCRLADFGSCILTTARQCNEAVRNADIAGLGPHQVAHIRTRVLQLWSLFPDFCYFGCADIPASFPRIAKILEGAMKDPSYPELLPHIVAGLTHLARVAREKVEGGSVPPNASQAPDLVTLRNHCAVFLPALLEFLETVEVSDPRFQAGVQCVSEWTAISAPPLVTAITKKLLQLLLTSTHAMSLASSSTAQQSENAAAGWMAVMQSIIPHLSAEMVALLFRTVRPLLSVDESISLQKRAYHVLDGLLKSHGDIIHSTESRSSILEVISDSLLTCHVSARNMRLRCMESLVGSMPDEEVYAASESLLGEILVCQKDANKKSRDASLGLLRMLIKRLPSNVLFMQLCSAVVGETAVMRSSGMIGLCVLLLEKRNDMDLLHSATELVPTVTILLKEECVEQTRAILSLVRVCSSVLPVPSLVSILTHVVYSFTEGLGPHRAKFTSRARAIMRKLVHRVGEAALRPCVPPQDMPLLDYIQKQARRAFKRKQQRDKDIIAKMLGSDSESSDGESDEEEADAVVGAKADKDPRLVARPKAVRAKDLVSTLPSSLDDLLEDQTGHFSGSVPLTTSVSARSKRERSAVPAGNKSSGRGGQDSSTAMDVATSGSTPADEDDEAYNVVVTADGKVVVQTKEVDESAAVGGAAADGGGAGGKHGTGNLSGKKYGRGNDADEEEEGTKDSANAQKRARAKEPGEEYRSKKAGGDVWKKGMLEPHAYIPLDPRLMSKKHQREAIGTFGSVVNAKKLTGAKTRMLVGNRKQRRKEREQPKRK